MLLIFFYAGGRADTSSVARLAMLLHSTADRLDVLRACKTAWSPSEIRDGLTETTRALHNESFTFCHRSSLQLAPASVAAQNAAYCGWFKRPSRLVLKISKISLTNARSPEPQSGLGERAPTVGL